MDGTYNLHGEKMNGRNYWVSSDKKMAMWNYGNPNTKRWCIAYKEFLKEKEWCGLKSYYFYGNLCPYHVNWLYFNSSYGNWKYTDQTTDIQIECSKKGMLIFLTS